MRRVPLAQRFWEKVDRRGPDECWPWLASTKSKGYGAIGDGAGRVVRAHRVAWELTHGSTGKMHVLHSCDNQGCCNPAHLFLGTNIDNVRDRVAKGRTAKMHLAALLVEHPELRPRGERHGRAKITEQDVREIRTTRDSISGAEWARRLGVSQKAISLVRQGRNWHHVS